MLINRGISVPRYPAGTKMHRTRFLLKIVIALYFLVETIEAPRNKGVNVADHVYRRLVNFLERDPCNSITYMWISQAAAIQQADGNCAAIFNEAWMRLDTGSRKKCAGAQNARCVDVTVGKVLHASQQQWSCQVDLPALWCQKVFCGVKTITVDLQECVRRSNLVRPGPTETTPLLG